jgi:hypothetical protein
MLTAVRSGTLVVTDNFPKFFLCERLKGVGKKNHMCAGRNLQTKEKRWRNVFDCIMSVDLTCRNLPKTTC